MDLNDNLLKQKYSEFLEKGIDQIEKRDYEDLKLKEKYAAHHDAQERLFSAIEEDSFRDGFLYGYACAVSDLKDSTNQS